MGETLKTGSIKYAKEVLSTDVKPIGAFSGQELIETDTGDVFEWSGKQGAWYQRNNDADNPLPVTNDPINFATESKMQQEEILEMMGKVVKQLKIMNVHLESITDIQIKLSDVEV
jgi:hypothetical protein